MDTPVHFESAGLKLAGVLHRPDDLAPGERRAALIVLHGFGSNKNGGISQAAIEYDNTGIRSNGCALP